MMGWAVGKKVADIVLKVYATNRENENEERIHY